MRLRMKKIQMNLTMTTVSVSSCMLWLLEYYVVLLVILNNDLFFHYEDFYKKLGKFLLNFRRQFQHSKLWRFFKRVFWTFIADHCAEDEFICGGRCFELEKRCDGVPDCVDYSDEANCPPSTERISSEVSFQKATLFWFIRWEQSQCFKIQNLVWLFNWILLCFQRCPEDQCADGTCIYNYQRCDGVKDCRTGEDESGCRKCQITFSIEILFSNFMSWILSQTLP